MSTNEKFTNAQFCSPSVKFSDNTCFSKKSLIKIAENIERKKKVKISKNLSKKNLWKRIKLELSEHCNEKTEVCWITHPVLSDMLNIESSLYNDDQDDLSENARTILNNTFKPPKPKGKYAWLSTLDIEKVMDQYEKIKWQDDKNFNFSYIGPVPIDFDYKDSLGQCVSNELCNIDLKKLFKKGIKFIGITFNLDPHYKPGIHWVSMFIDFESDTIEYFDSFGIAPPEEVYKLVNKFIENCKKQNIKLIFSWNNKEIQRNNSECGIYSIYFLTQRLHGNTFDDIIKKLKKKRSADYLMNSLRDIFFINSKYYNLKDMEAYEY
jgi:hypothetical protein